MKKDTHLPLYGVGPIYGFVIILITILSIMLSKNKLFYLGVSKFLEIPFIIIGILLIALGTYLWIRGVLVDKVDNNIKQNKLLTSGIYALVRNPIYAALSFVCDGVLFITLDLWLLVLPFVFWILLTLLMKLTEEKWLKDLYGKEYEKYCERVNRCIPWFPKNFNKQH